MARVLISLLGTGRIADGDKLNNRYQTTNYLLEGKVYENLSFSSLAIINHYNIQKVYFIGTKDSMWDNLADVFKGSEEEILKLIEKIDESRLEILNKIIDNYLGFNGSKCILVKKGENEEELWEIFNKLLEIVEDLEEDDEVYFDITHLFRSHSVMSFIIAEFMKAFKNVKIEGVFYAMLKKDTNSLIINVKVFFELLEWVRAIEDIEEYASFHRFVNLSQKYLNQYAFNVINDVRYAFDLAYMSSIYSSIKRLFK